MPQIASGAPQTFQQMTMNTAAPRSATIGWIGSKSNNPSPISETST